ncbi:MAG: IS66 family insertion sequence element accessory protein TnpB [Clostridia bacterium]|nr:IS66 family insertion sequence element accessory protein TnpB [Clostridia bacterium]
MAKTSPEQQNQWATRIAAFHTSGKTVSAWCAEHHVKPHQLRYRLRKQHSLAETGGETPTQWLPLNLRDLETTTPPLVIRIGQATVEVRPGFDHKLLLEVVRTLGAQC